MARDLEEAEEELERVKVPILLLFFHSILYYCVLFTMITFVQ